MTQMWRRVRMDRRHLAVREAGVIALVRGGAVVAPPRAQRLFALEPQHGPSFSLSLLMQVHEAAAVVTRENTLVHCRFSPFGGGRPPQLPRA